MTEDARSIKCISDMVKQIDQQSLCIGTSHVLTKYADSSTSSCIWEDSDKCGYAISKCSTPSLSTVEANSLSCLVVESQLSGVWAIGDSAFLKVNVWSLDMEAEAETIHWVHQNVPTVPVPNILWEYIDKEACYSFMILEKLPGEELNEIWKVLSVKQQQEVVQQVAQHVKDLAGFKSGRLESTQGKLICEPYLDFTNNMHPFTLHLLKPDNVKEYQNIWGLDQNLLVFQHADLGPKNIMVDVQDGMARVSGILDWAIAGFLPKAWICTKVLVSPGMNFQWGNHKDEGETQWRRDLAGALINLGYESFGPQWMRWDEQFNRD